MSAQVLCLRTPSRTHLGFLDDSLGLDGDSREVIGNVLTRRALETHRLEVGLGLLLRTPVDDMSGSDDHDLVEQVVDVVSGLQARKQERGVRRGMEGRTEKRSNAPGRAR